MFPALALALQPVLCVGAAQSDATKLDGASCDVRKIVLASAGAGEKADFPSYYTIASDPGGINECMQPAASVSSSKPAVNLSDALAVDVEGVVGSPVSTYQSALAGWLLRTRTMLLATWAVLAWGIMALSTAWFGVRWTRVWTSFVVGCLGLCGQTTHRGTASGAMPTIVAAATMYAYELLRWPLGRALQFHHVVTFVLIVMTAHILDLDQPDDRALCSLQYVVHFTNVAAELRKADPKRYSEAYYWVYVLTKLVAIGVFHARVWALEPLPRRLRVYRRWLLSIHAVQLYFVAKIVPRMLNAARYRGVARRAPAQLGLDQQRRPIGASL